MSQVTVRPSEFQLDRVTVAFAQILRDVAGVIYGLTLEAQYHVAWQYARSLSGRARVDAQDHHLTYRHILGNHGHQAK